jgi:CheY-like chemotaxis protein
MPGRVEILLVEDNPNDLELTLRALKRNDVSNRIQVVRDGAEALEFLFCNGRYADRNPTDRPSVVLLDLKLPKVDGLEVLDRVRRDDRTRTIPVVILTSSREENDVIESYRRGGNSYVVKPVDFGNFTDTVGRVGRYWVALNVHPAA